MTTPFLRTNFWLSAVIVLTAILYAGHALAAGEGVHPWDQPDRRHGSERRSYRTTRYLSDPYYRRTETHALHPYYRNHYHDVLVVDDSVTTEYFRRNYLNSFPFNPLPSVTTHCSRYSYYRAYGRMPPTDFECQEY